MKISGININLGETRQIDLPIAKLTSGTQIDVPVIISRGQNDGPALLLMAGLHGDEINSVDVVRTIIDQGINKVDTGTVICIPILNVFGFINFSREVPDGKDVNRSFPGHSKGSLASQIAYQLTKKILPHCDHIIDFHTGGKSRYNTPQTRALLDNESCKALAMAFNAPFTLHSNLIKKSLRETAIKSRKSIIVYEGGEALRFDKSALNIALTGTRKVINYLNMKHYDQSKITSIVKFKRKWLRAPSSGFFHPLIAIGDEVSDQQVFGKVSGPYGDYQKDCITPTGGHIITLNNNPLVNRGDAIMQIAY